MTMRASEIKRETKETVVDVSIHLDGEGAAKIDTGVGFFDHMLDLLGKHSLMDITITAKGDTHVDDHPDCRLCCTHCAVCMARLRA